MDKYDAEYIDVNLCIRLDTKPKPLEDVTFTRHTYSLSPNTVTSINQMRSIFYIGKSELVNKSVALMSSFAESLDRPAFLLLTKNLDCKDHYALDLTAGIPEFRPSPNQRIPGVDRLEQGC